MQLPALIARTDPSACRANRLPGLRQQDEKPSAAVPDLPGEAAAESGVEKPGDTADAAGPVGG